MIGQLVPGTFTALDMAEEQALEWVINMEPGDLVSHILVRPYKSLTAFLAIISLPITVVPEILYLLGYVMYFHFPVVLLLVPSIFLWYFLYHLFPGVILIPLFSSGTTCTFLPEILHVCCHVRQTWQINPELLSVPSLH